MLGLELMRDQIVPGRLGQGLVKHNIAHLTQRRFAWQC